MGLMEGAFWKKILANVLSKGVSLSKKKVVKRAVKAASLKQPGMRKEFLQKELTSYMDKERNSGFLVDVGTKLALAPSAGGPRVAKLELKPPRTPPSALNTTKGIAEDVSIPAERKSKKRKAATGQAVDEEAEATERIAKTAKGSKDQTGIQAGAASKEDGAEDIAGQHVGAPAADAEPTARVAKGTNDKKTTAARKPFSATNGVASKRKTPAETSVGEAEQAPASEPKKKSKGVGASDGAAASLSPKKMPAISSSTKANADWRTSNARTDVKRGRYTPAEREKLLQAVKDYAHSKGLSDTDLTWLFRTKTGEQRSVTEGAWAEIATTALPHRTAKSVWSYGTRILHPDYYKGSWKNKDKTALVALVEARGKKWKDIGAELGRLPGACKDCYKELAVGGERRGKWSKEEEAALESAVNEFLTTREAFKAREEHATLSLDDLAAAPAADGMKKADGRLLLDDIDWNAIADKVGTRTAKHCLDKWYRQLAPSMVARGEWGSGDDRRLLKALLASGATHEHEVSWGNMVPNRTAHQAQRRWRLMVKRVPDRYDKEFDEHLNFLVDTFAPNLRNATSDPEQAA